MTDSESEIQVVTRTTPVFGVDNHLDYQLSVQLDALSPLIGAVLILV